MGSNAQKSLCLNDACRHQGLVDVSSYPADTASRLVPRQGQMRQVRRVRTAHRRAAELERAAGNA